jgi:hypothetical protein
VTAAARTAYMSMDVGWRFECGSQGCWTQAVALLQVNPESRLVVYKINGSIGPRVG